MKKKISKTVWYDETESRLPELCGYEDVDNEDAPNGDEIVIRCSLAKPKTNFKRIKITVEEL